MKLIQVKTPVRIDLAGGWTDVAPYTHDMGGEVVNFAINRYIHATFKVDEEDKISVSYESDIPTSSGLGTSGAMNVAFLAAISGEGRTSEEIAELAFQFEALLGNRGGRQDQWAAALGGFQHLLFAGEHVEPLPFEPMASAKRWLHKHLILAYTGITHISGDLHQKIWERYDAGEESVHQALRDLRNAAKSTAVALQQDRRQDLLAAIRMVTSAIDKMDPELNDCYRNFVEPLVNSKDVLAWKGMGAGSGGCIGLIANLNKVDTVKETCKEYGWTVIDWDYDEEGMTRTVTES